MECKDEDRVRCNSFDSDLQEWIVSFTRQGPLKEKTGLEEKTTVQFGNGLPYQIFEFRCQVENCYTCGELREEVKQFSNNFISSKKKNGKVYCICLIQKEKKRVKEGEGENE